MRVENMGEATAGKEHRGVVATRKFTKDTDNPTVGPLKQSNFNNKSKHKKHGAIWVSAYKAII